MVGLCSPTAVNGNEWLKIMISVVSGMLVGTLSEPLKAAFQWQARLHRAERAIAFDLVTLQIGWTAVKAELVPLDNFWAGISLPGFDYYWSKERDIFYDNYNLHTLMLRCLLIQRLLEGVKSESINKQAAETQLERVLADFSAESKKPASLTKRVMRRLRF